SPIASRTRMKTSETAVALQAPLREAANSGGGTMILKVPFSTTDLGEWRKVAKEYRSDPVGVSKHFQFIVKQHNPDWGDIQLLLDYMTETEKQLILKKAGDLAGDFHSARDEDVKEFFPLQDPRWDPNRSAEMNKLQNYQGWVVKGMEKAIPQTINWSALYAIKQGPTETPSEFLDRLRDTMRRHTPLDPGSEVGIQQLVSLC
ncbi:hypothetical protein FQV07_0009214, partial [Pygoscelis papua]